MLKKSRCEYATMVYALDQGIGMLRTTMESNCANPDTLENIEYTSKQELEDGPCTSSHWDNTVVVFMSDNGGYNQQGHARRTHQFVHPSHARIGFKHVATQASAPFRRA